MKTIGQRGIIVLAISLLIAIALPQAIALAANDEVWVNGVNIVTASHYTVGCGTGTAVYDPQTETLLLTDAQITNLDGSGSAINAGADIDLTIALKGKNTISTTTGIGINADKSLGFTGDGTLDIRTLGFCIYSGGDITFDGTEIKAESTGSGAILSNAAIVCENGANIQSNGLHFALSSTGDMTITGSAVNATASDDTTYAYALTPYGSLTIENGSDVTAESEYIALFSVNAMIIKDSKVNAVSNSSIAIWTLSNLTVEGCELTAKGFLGAMNTTGDTSLTGSTLKLTGDMEGINSSGDLTISNCKDMSVKAGACAILGHASMAIQNCTGDIENVGFDAGVGLVYGVAIEAQDLTISGADTDLKIKGTNAIACVGDMVFSGGKLSAIGINGSGIDVTGSFSHNSGRLHAKGTNAAISVRMISSQSDLTNPPAEPSAILTLNDDYADEGGARPLSTGWHKGTINDSSQGTTETRWMYHSSFVPYSDAGPLDVNYSNAAKEVTIDLIQPQITVDVRPPKTGDDGMPLLWLSLCVLCSAGLALLLSRRRRA